jgi:hypothetical protein
VVAGREERRDLFAARDLELCHRGNVGEIGRGPRPASSRQLTARGEAISGGDLPYIYIYIYFIYIYGIYAATC